MVVVALVGYSTFLDRTYGAFFVLFLIYFVFSFGFVWSCLASLFPPAKGKRLAVFLAWLIETLIRTAKIFAIVSVAALIGVLLSELLGLQRVSIATAVTYAMIFFFNGNRFLAVEVVGGATCVLWQPPGGNSTGLSRSPHSLLVVLSCFAVVSLPAHAVDRCAAIEYRRQRCARHADDRCGRLDQFGRYLAT